MIPRFWCSKVAAQLSLIGYTSYSQNWLHYSPKSQIVVVIGAMLCIIHYGILKKQAKCLSTPAKLVTQGGLFRWIRHPMYLGDLVITIGFFSIALDVIAGILTTWAVWAILRQCSREDAQMQSLFPEQFADWKTKTQLVVSPVLLVFVVVFWI